MILITLFTLLLSLFWFLALQFYACAIGTIVWYTGKRIHWIEIHEEAWCPMVLRELGLNCVVAMWCNFGLPDWVGSRAQTVANVIQQKYAGQNLNILDLCSGTGGPAMAVTDQLAAKLRSVTTILTDLIPMNEKWRVIASNNAHMAYCTQPVDATAVNLSAVFDNLKGKTPQTGGAQHTNLRTIFGALHHFKADAIISILSDVMTSNDDFMAVELSQRHSLHRFVFLVLGQCMFIPLFVFSLMKYYLFDHRELSTVERAMYVLLVLAATPLYITILVHDGIVSYARSYKEQEIHDMVQMAMVKAGKNNEDYQWKIWKQDSNLIAPFNKSFPLIILHGRPAKQ